MRVLAGTTASNLLFGLTLLQLLSGACLFPIVRSQTESTLGQMVPFIVMWLGMTIVLGALSIWARFQPLPATIIALALHVARVAAYLLSIPFQPLLQSPMGIILDMAVYLFFFVGLLRALQLALGAHAAPATGDDMDEMLGENKEWKQKALLKKALRHEAAGEVEQAVQCLEKVLQLTADGPNAQWVRERLGELRKRAGGPKA